MYSLPTTPKSIGGVLDDIFKLFPRAIAVSWPIAVIGSIVLSLPGFFLATKSRTTPEEILSAFMDPVFWSLYLVTVLVYAVLYGALVARIDSAANNRNGSIAEALATAVRRGPRLIGAGVLYFLAIMVGFLLLVVPGIMLSVSMMLFYSYIVIENSGAVESLSNSRQLVRGAWWRTFTILTVAMVIAYLLLFCVQFAIGFTAALGNDPLAFGLISTLVTAVVYVVLLPFMVATSLSIYYDLKLRKEGGDLSDRVASLAKS